jgi:pimeloyl-ACP methyl ester carboxylesterase
MSSSLAYGDEHLDERQGLIAAPSSVLWGQDDTLTPVALWHRIAEVVPGARLLVLEASAPSLDERRRQ